MSDRWRDEDPGRDFGRPYDEDRERGWRAERDRSRGGPWSSGGPGYGRGYARNEGWRPRGEEDRYIDDARRSERMSGAYRPHDYDRGGYGAPDYDDRGDYRYGGPRWEDRGEGYARNQGWRGERDDYRREVGRREPSRSDRGWWDRTRDEVGSWFGDEEAERRRRMDAEREGRFRDERRGDTGWSDPFSGPGPRSDRTDRDYWRSRERDRWDRDRSW